MPHKPSRKPENIEEYKRFLETAKELEADKDQEALDRAFKSLARVSTQPS